MWAGRHKLNMQSESRYAITALPFPRFAQIHIKLWYVFGVWHLHTFSEEEMRVGLLNINAGPDARLAVGIYLNLLQQVWAQQVPSASRRSTQPLDHLEALKDYICAEPRPDQYTRGDGEEGLKEGEERERRGRGEGEMIVSSQRVGGERESEGAWRWMGCGVRLGKHSPLFASLFPFFSQGQTENWASCSCLSVRESVCVCVCVCVCVGEVDLGGLYISSRESPPTNLPPGALGHWPPSLLPRDPQAAPRPPATSLVLTVMRTPRRGEEEETVYVSLPKEGDIRWLEKHDSAHPPLLSSPLLSSPLPPSLLAHPIPPSFLGLCLYFLAVWAVELSPSCCCSTRLSGHDGEKRRPGDC